MMKLWKPGAPLRYGTAALAVMLATVARLALDPVLGDRFPFATLFFAVLIAAGFGGRGPGLLATLLGALASAWFLLPPRGSLAISGLENQAGMVVYLGGGAGIALLGGALHSSRRRAEGLAADALRQRERSRATLASIGDAVVVSDARGRVTSMNRVAEALTGWTQAEAEGRPHAEVLRIVHEETGEPAESPIAGVYREGRVVKLASHMVLVARDGARRPIDDTAAPIRDEDGTIGGVVLVFRDASGRRQAERELRESEARKAAILESALDCVITIDYEGRVVEFNPAAEATFGYARADVVGREMCELIIPPALREAHRRGMARYLATGEGPVLGRRIEIPAIRSDGTEFPVELAITRISTSGPPSFTAYVRDITGRKRAEEEVRAARDEAEHANHAKDQFLAVLSHELRTPLNPILLAASSMLEGGGEIVELRPTLEMIRQNVNLQARLIDDLLDVMRIARGKMPLHWECVDCHDVIRQALQVCQSEVFGKSIALTIDLAAARPRVEADPARLQQVFWNLIKNSVKFSPEGATLAIRTRNEGQGDRLLVVEVSDTGIGIDPGVLPTIWDPFQQGERSVTRRFGGLGLGLAICRGIVDAHGGTIVAESPGVGQGTTFRIELRTLPVSEVAANGRGPAPLAVPIVDRSPAPHLEILVVEDEEATRRLMARLLRGLGHGVMTAGTVAEAVEAVEAAGVLDLIVSDIGLPDGSGLELMRRVVHARGKVPSIALTGYGMEEDIQRSREAGFTAHMTKPIDFIKLEAMIRQVAR